MRAPHTALAKLRTSVSRSARVTRRLIEVGARSRLSVCGVDGVELGSGEGEGLLVVGQARLQVTQGRPELSAVLVEHRRELVTPTPNPDPFHGPGSSEPSGAAQGVALQAPGSGQLDVEALGGGGGGSSSQGVEPNTVGHHAGPPRGGVTEPDGRQAREHDADHHQGHDGQPHRRAGRHPHQHRQHRRDGDGIGPEEGPRSSSARLHHVERYRHPASPARRRPR
jgi:hypothetical protein